MGTGISALSPETQLLLEGPLPSHQSSTWKPHGLGFQWGEALAPSCGHQFSPPPGQGPEFPILGGQREGSPGTPLDCAEEALEALKVLQVVPGHIES